LNTDLVYTYFCISSRRRHTRWPRDWSSDVCSSDLSPLPHIELLAAKPGDAHDLADMQRAARVGAGRWNDDRDARIAPTGRRFDQDAHERFLPILCATSIKKSLVRFSLTHLRQVSPRRVSQTDLVSARIAPT